MAGIAISLLWLLIGAMKRLRDGGGRAFALSVDSLICPVPSLFCSPALFTPPQANQP